MPRKARIDIPGALHHIICRGIERRKIFQDDTDRVRRYSGHSALMGKEKRDWQDTDKVLALFANRPSSARRGYRQFVEDGIEMGRRPELTGGGLIRSAGGWVALKFSKRGGKSDERR